MKKFEIIFFTRVLYFFIYERKIILTNGFVKKTRKTPIEQNLESDSIRHKTVFYKLPYALFRIIRINQLLIAFRN